MGFLFIPKSSQKTERQHDYCMPEPKFFSARSTRVYGWVKMTHETKKIILAEVPSECLKELGCRNPDIWVQSRTDSTIVLTPPGKLSGDKALKPHVITAIEASEIDGIGDRWKQKIPVWKLETAAGAAIQEVLDAAANYPNLLEELDRLIEHHEIMEVFSCDDMPWIMVRFFEWRKNLNSV